MRRLSLLCSVGLEADIWLDLDLACSHSATTFSTQRSILAHPVLDVHRTLTLLPGGLGTQADVHRKVLLRACRNCDYEEDATAGLVYRNDLLTISKCVHPLSFDQSLSYRN